MSALVLDAGALIAIDRGDRDVHYRIQAAKQGGQVIRTNVMALAQVWRDGKGRQARLARVLRDITVEPITLYQGRGHARRPTRGKAIGLGR